MNYFIEQAALYNANDGLRYIYKDGDVSFDISAVCNLFLEKGTSRIIISSPGVENTPGNSEIFKKLLKIPVLSLMISLNRDHLISKSKLKSFVYTFSKYIKAGSLEIRLVYMNLKERSKLNELLKNIFKRLKIDTYKKNIGVRVISVPAIPIGRAKKIYFPGSIKKESDIKNKKNEIMQLFRDEQEIKELSFITDGSYNSFLIHGAIQFNNMFIILLRPSEKGMITELKVVDPEKVVKSKGVLYHTIYRYNEKKRRFIRTDDERHNRNLKIIIFNINILTVKNYNNYLSRVKYKGSIDIAVRIFEVFMKIKQDS